MALKYIAGVCAFGLSLLCCIVPALGAGATLLQEGFLSTADGSVVGAGSQANAVEIRYSITADGDVVSYRYEIAGAGEAGLDRALSHIIVQVPNNFGHVHIFGGTTPFSEVRSAAVDDALPRWDATGTAGIKWTLSGDAARRTLTIVTDRKPARGTFCISMADKIELRPAGEFWVPGMEPTHASDRLEPGISATGAITGLPGLRFSVLEGGSAIGGGGGGGGSIGRITWDVTNETLELPPVVTIRRPTRVPPDGLGPVPLTQSTPTPSETVPVVPLPSALWAGAVVLAIMGAHRLRRRYADVTAR
jgi:hypothetical protein